MKGWQKWLRISLYDKREIAVQKIKVQKVISFMIFSCTVQLKIMKEITSLKALLHYALSHWRFYFTSRFSSRFRYQHVGIQNARENARKTREKSKTRAQRETMFLYYTMRWVKNASQLRFGHVLVINISKTQTQRIV